LTEPRLPPPGRASAPGLTEPRLPPPGRASAPGLTEPGQRPTTGLGAKVAMTLGKVLAVAAGLAFLAVIVFVARFGAVPTWWLAGGAIILGAIGLAVLIPLWRTRLPGHALRFAVLTVAALVGLVGSAGTSLVLNDARQTIYHAIQSPVQPVVVYGVIALTSHADGLPSVAGQAVGGLTTDVNLARARAKLADIVPTEPQDFDGLMAATDALQAGHVQALLLPTSYLGIYEEARPDFVDQYKTLGTFAINAKPGPKPTVEPKPKSDAFVVYISGIDQYGSISGSGRSDVNILVVANPATGRILLVNTPRDFYVQLHGTTGLKDKLTHAGVYGIDMSVNTVSDLYSVAIDYYLRINFDTLIRLVDLVGGVDVNSDYSFSAGGYSFSQGVNHLDGAAALAFSRERHAFAGGDRVRGQNQELVIEALIKKMSEPGQLVRFNSVLETMASGMQTSMPGDAMMALVNQQLSTGRSWSVERTSVTGSDASLPTYTYGSQNLYVMIPDQATVDAAKAAIAAVIAGQ